jgi:hypothetical protein
VRTAVLVFGLVLLVAFRAKYADAAVADEKGATTSWVAGADYDPAVPAPSSVLGFALGERPAPVDALVAYARLLAKTSDRVSLQEIGHSAEGVPLLLLAITDPLQQAEMEESRRALLDAPNSQGKAASVPPLPAVWIACSIHGDEASGSDAGMFLAYHLAADRSEQTKTLLKKILVLIDPCQNPDGRRRFLEHLRAFTRQAGGPDPYPLAIEHTQFWPGGRYNHNLFDLNRDWAFLTQPETRARVAAFLRFVPQVFVDLHEMGPSSSYFFPPSAKPHNPLLPEELQSWLDDFGKANAAAFDAAGMDYFVREEFDLFYPGYGDSWPCLQGAIGMTYEQATTRGLCITPEGKATRNYEDAVHNHFLAALTTCVESAAKGKQLLEYSRRFRQEALREAHKRDVKEIIFDASEHPAEARRLAWILSTQGAEVLRSKTGFRAEVSTPQSGEEDKREFPAGSYRVVLEQPAYPLLANLLGPEQQLDEDFLQEEARRHEAGLRNRFYDVTAWSLPLAFGLTSYYSSKSLRVASERVDPQASPKVTKLDSTAASYGYLIPYRDDAALAALTSLWRGGAQVYLARDALRQGGEDFPAGSLVLKRSAQPKGLDLDSLLTEVVSSTGVRAVPTASAWSDEGPSLGSDRVVRLHPPRIVVATGPGVRPTGVGSLLWSLQEHLGVDCSAVLLDRLDDVRLREVDVIVLPDMEKQTPELPLEDLRSWVDQGGTLVALGRACEKLMELPDWLKASLVSDAKAEESGGAEADPQSGTPGPPPPALSDEANWPEGARNPTSRTSPRSRHDSAHPFSQPSPTPGAIFRLQLAPYHFLGYGSEAPLFALVRSDRMLQAGEDDLVCAFYADHEPRVAGFAWPETTEGLAGRPYALCEAHEKGKIILFAEDPTFRGIWPLTTRLLVNAILLGPALPR